MPIEHSVLLWSNIGRIFREIVVLSAGPRLFIPFSFDILRPLTPDSKFFFAFEDCLPG